MPINDNNSADKGSITVVGLGPGGSEWMSKRGAAALQAADTIVGYSTYLALIPDLLIGKEVIGTGMMQEVERCQAAVDNALKGKKTAVISSGDPGIYGMAGLVLELAMKVEASARPDVEIVPGISAVNAAAAILGAPLMHDFVVISMSDLLTPLELIYKRARMAAQGDFVTAVYNPKSTKRTYQIEKLREIFLQYRDKHTPVGIVNHAMREKQSAVLSDLERFTHESIDMFSLVIIGNSQTYVQEGKMITPRGYRL